MTLKFVTRVIVKTIAKVAATTSVIPIEETKMRRLSPIFAATVLVALTSFSAAAQDKKDKKKGFQEVYTGTIYSMNGGGFSTGFNLSIRDFTSEEDTSKYLGILAEGDQETLLKTIDNNDLGRLSATGHTGRNLLAVRKTQTTDGKTRIVAVFERWQGVREVRGGYRSLDYPFGIIEIIVNEKGKGSGTFIAACKIDMKRDKKTGKWQLELENFGTYPHKLMGVMRR